MSAEYTLIVGTKDWSSWSLRPWLALRHAGVAFKEKLIPLRRDSSSPEIFKYSPSGRVPALIVEEAGKSALIWDSLAICETIAERHREAQLWPADPLVRAEARSYAAEMHSGFPDLREQLSMDFARRLPTPPLREATRTQIARIQQAWRDALMRYGDSGGFLFGRFSIADCMYAPVVSRFKSYGIELDEPLTGYAARMMALPAMQDWGKAAKAEVDAGLA